MGKEKIKDTKKENITFSNGGKPLTEYISYPFHFIPVLVVVNGIREWNQEEEKMNDEEKVEVSTNEDLNGHQD